MVNNKIIMVDLNTDFPEACAVQYDYGQTLRIQGGNLPKAVEVHFSLDETGGTSITRIGTKVDGVTEAPVPDSMLENNDCEQNYSFYAFVYLRDEHSGNTEHKITVRVKARSKPEIPGDVEEPQLFGEVMRAVNEAADRAEVAEEKAKANAEEAGNYAKSASESAAMAEKTKEDALEEIREKQQKVISSIKEQEEIAVGKVTEQADTEIERIESQSSESKRELEQTITEATAKNEKLEESIQTADTIKTKLDKATELAGDAKTELDTSARNAGTAKTALDTSISEAAEQKQALDTTVEQAGEVNTSLSEKISDAGQILESVAQIETNKEDISSLKEEMSKNVLDDAKTKRSLDALWKLNHGISYQFETDAEKAYQKDVPSGAKLASVKKIGGKTIVWNQYSNILGSKTGWGYSAVDNKKCAELSEHMVYIKYKSVVKEIKEEANTYSRRMYFLGDEVLAVGEETVSQDDFTVGRTVETKVIKKTPKNIKNIYAYNYGNNVIGVTASCEAWINIIDLTQMFGAGNEPSVEEFESIFPDDYYEYNEGTLMSMPVNEVVEQGRNLWSFGSELKFRGVVEYKFSVFEEKRVITLKYNYPNGYGTGVGVPCVVCLGENETELKSQLLNESAIIPVGTAKIRIYSNGFDYNASKEIDVVLTDIQLEKGTTATSYAPYHQNTYPIPQAILDLDGYGDGVSNEVYNYVDFEEKKYHKRVGRVDLGSLNWSTISVTVGSDTFDAFRSTVGLNRPRQPGLMDYMCSKYEVANSRASTTEDKTIAPFNGTSDNRIVVHDSSYTDVSTFKAAMQGVMLYYELAEEDIIDISDIIDNTFQEPIEVEAGGTLTFKNSNGDGYRLSVPNEEEYIVSLAEVSE